VSSCRSCGAPIVWALTLAGKRIPLDPPEKRLVQRDLAADGTKVVDLEDTWISHFATCPQADSWRRERG